MEIVVAVASALIGALVGGVIAHFSQASNWRRNESQEARLPLRLVPRRRWADAHSWSDLQEALGEAQVRMTTVAPNRIAALEEAATRCSRDVHRNIDEQGVDPDDEVFIDGEFHDWLLAVVASLDEELMQRGKPGWRRRRPPGLPAVPEEA